MDDDTVLLISSYKRWKMNILDTRPNIAIEICKLQLWNSAARFDSTIQLNDTMDQ